MFDTHGRKLPRRVSLARFFFSQGCPTLRPASPHLSITVSCSMCPLSAALLILAAYRLMWELGELEIAAAVSTCSIHTAVR